MTRIELAPEVLDDVDRFLDHMAGFEVEDAPERIGQVVQTLHVLTHGPSSAAGSRAASANS